MSWTVKSCLITLAVLCLWQVDEGANACSCIQGLPQEHFCNSDVVIKAKVLSMQKIGITHHGPITTYGYNIKQLKIYKGGCVTFNIVYTASSSARCGVRLEHGKDYLFSGSLQNGRLHINLCSFNVQWDKLTDGQKLGLTTYYDMGCGCKITRCNSYPCALSRSMECLWGDDAVEKKLFGKTIKDYYCVQTGADSCSWCKDKTNCLD